MFAGDIRTLTSPVTASNLTPRFVSIPPGQIIPGYTVLEKGMDAQTPETGHFNELLIENTAGSNGAVRDQYFLRVKFWLR
jgi:hypothetical protein